MKVEETKENNCKHEWSEVSRKKSIAGYVPAGFFTNGLISYKTMILQKCNKCGKLDVLEF